MSLTLQEIAVEVGEWSRRNFGIQESKLTGEVLGSIAPLLGMMEELGEFGEAFTGTHEERQDALGDIGIYLCDFAQRDGATLLDNGPTSPIYRMSIAIPLGKLAHCVLKRHQGIRGFDDLKKYSEDRDKAIVSLVENLNAMSLTWVGLSFVQIVEETWQRVKLRDWQKNNKSAHLEDKNEMYAKAYGKLNEPSGQAPEAKPEVAHGPDGPWQKETE